MLLFAPYNQTSLQVPTTTHISYTPIALDRPGGGGQIAKLESGRIKISSTLSYFQNSNPLSLFFSYFLPCAYNALVPDLVTTTTTSVCKSDVELLLLIDVTLDLESN